MLVQYSWVDIISTNLKGFYVFKTISNILQMSRFCGFVCLFNIPNGVRKELKFQMALRLKLGLFLAQWQCRFRTLASKVSFV